MTTQANTYTVLAGPPSFSRSDFDFPRFYPENFTRDIFYGDHSQFTEAHKVVDVARDFHTRIWDTNAFEILDASRCAQEYNRQYVSSWGDLFLELSPRVVYLIQKQCPASYRLRRYTCASLGKMHLVVEWDDREMIWSTPKSSNLSEHTWVDFSGSDPTYPSLLALSIPSSYPSYQWLDSKILMERQINGYKTDPSRLTPFKGAVVNCRAEKVPENCRLNFNLSFALVVVACNLIQLITMSLTLWLHRTPTLITTGDAINSFLIQPDEMTSGLCLLSGATMSFYWAWGTGSSGESLQLKKFKKKWLDNLTSPVYKPERLFWGQSASSMRWTMCFVLYSPPYRFSS